MIGVNPEIRNRIRLSVAAYAYEFENDSLFTDEEFDQLASIIDPEVETGHLVMDEFFRQCFHPETGMWVHNHPDKPGLKKAYRMLKQSDIQLDLRFNRDLFKPMIKAVESKPVENECRRCRKDFMRSPANGGCHC